MRKKVNFYTVELFTSVDDSKKMKILSNRNRNMIEILL